MNLLVLICGLCAISLCSVVASAEEKEDVLVDQATESPIADTALVGDALKADIKQTEKESAKPHPLDSQPHTVADFIIHPLIALKPRLPETETGKQADGSATTSSPWQFFGFNGGQGLGSSVSSLAGSVTGWLGNRIQLPGLVDTPVRESSITSTTTTTARPDVVVRVHQRATTKKPLISINNNNARPNRRFKRPNRYNVPNYVDDSEENDDSIEYDDYENFNGNRGNRKRYPENEEEDDNVDVTYEQNEDDAEEDEDDEDDYNNGDEGDVDENEERPVKQSNDNRRRNPKPLTFNKRRNTYNQRRPLNKNQPRKQNFQQEESAEEDQYEDEDDDQEFQYNTSEESKRSQNELNFIQRSQQNLLKQIRQLTRGQTPAEVGNSLRKAQKSNKNKRLQQATLLIKRNGQTVYVAPELLEVPHGNRNKVSGTAKKPSTSNYPQPPLTVPYKRKGQPTQYITIPWTQLGISPPDQLASVTEGIQSQPLILNIPQSALENMQKFGNKNKKPSLTADAVPLLAEASIMDIFKPPRIPPARTPSKKPTASNAPVVIATKTKAGPARILPGTIVEKSPVQANMDTEQTNSSESMEDDDKSMQFLVISGDPAETKLSRSAYKQIMEYFNQRRSGRQLSNEQNASEQLIPVQIISEEKQPINGQENIDDEVQTSTESPIVMEDIKMESSEPVKNEEIKPVTEAGTPL